MLRIGVIGLGRMGMLHLMNCLKNENAIVVAAADRSRKALAKAKSFGIDKLYSDYNELLEIKGLDAVIISLPNFLHYESAKAALGNGLNVFMEKPLANSIQECEEISRLVHRSGKKFMIGHSMRYMEAVEKMKKQTDEGFIGNLEVITIEEVINGPFSHPRVPSPVSEWWFDREKSGGGALLDIGYHLIDLFRFFGGDCDVIFSCLDHKFNLPVEDGAILILRSRESGIKGIINTGWYQQTIFPKFNFRVVLHGGAGYLSSENFVPRNLYLHAAKEGAKNLFRRITLRKIRPLYYTYYYESYYKELSHFLNCVKNDHTPSVSVEDGLKTIQVIREAYKKYQKKEVNC